MVNIHNLISRKKKTLFINSFLCNIYITLNNMLFNLRFFLNSLFSFFYLIHFIFLYVFDLF